MIRNILCILILLLVGNYIYGQITVHGLILDENGLPFPGVTILETSTDSGTVTDIKGKFELSLQTDTSCIRTSFVGYLDTLLCDLTDSIPPIRLFPDIKSINDIVISSVDYNYVDNTMIGFYSGVIHNPFGLICSNFTSYLFKIPLMTVTQIEYRTDFKESNNFHFGLARYHGNNHKNFQFGLSYDYELIAIDEDEINLDYLSHKFNSTWTYKKTYLFLGYGYSKREVKFHHGLLSSLAFNIPIIHVGLFASLNFWFDYTEYSVDVFKTIPKTQINVGVGFEGLEDYKEINIRLRYQIDY